MPWKKKDAKRHTKKARTEKSQSLWAKIANRMLADGRSEGSAVRIATSVIKKRHGV